MRTFVRLRGALQAYHRKWVLSALNRTLHTWSLGRPRVDHVMLARLLIHRPVHYALQHPLREAQSAPCLLDTAMTEFLFMHLLLQS